VRIEDPTSVLSAVQAAVSDAVAGGGWYRPEARPFLAHVTVARVARGARTRAIDLPVPELEFTGATVTLFRSRTDPRGARYEPLSRVELSRPGSPSQ
jgi:2'-5' RNA ligase